MKMDEIEIQVVDKTNDSDYQCFVATARTKGKLLGILQYEEGYGDTAYEALDRLMNEIKKQLAMAA
jgi:hypothetical protein